MPDIESFLTESAYKAYRNKQDDDIQKAFVAQASLIENLHDHLTTTFDQKLSTVHDSLTLAFDKKLSTVHGALGKLNNEMVEVKKDVQDLKGAVGQLQDEVKELQDEVRELKVEVKELKIEVKELKIEVCKIHSRFDRMEGRSYNSTRILPHHTIAVIGVYTEAIGMILPVYFPSTVKEFWKLRNTNYRHKLLYLVKFYDVQNYQYWGHTHLDFNSDPAITSSEDSDSDTSQHDLSLEKAVDQYPNVALDELAYYFGLPMSEIRDYFQRISEFQMRQRQPPPATKRQAPVMVSGRKIVRPSPPPPAQPRIPLEELLAGPSPTASLVAPSPRVQWDDELSKTVLAEAAARRLAAPSDSGSSTDAISSQGMRDFSRREKLRLQDKH